MTDNAPNAAEAACAIRLLLALRPHFPNLPTLSQIDLDGDYGRDLIAAIRIESMVFEREQAKARQARKRSRDTA